MTATGRTPILPTGLQYVLVATALFLSATSSPAGRIPEEWDALPDIDAFSFSETSVGLGGAYLLDRATGRLREIPREQFEQVFAGAVGAKAAEVKEETGTASKVLLRTSSGRELTTQDAYCAEGEDSEHALWMDGTPVKDHVDPCISVSCAEIVGENLWLGTRYDGEYGEYPATGIVVQSLDQGRLVKKLGTGQGLTGDLIRAIRFDPFDRTVWIATNEGINVVDRDFRVRRSSFFYQEVNPDSGSPEWALSPTKRKNDPIVTFLEQLHTSDAKRFYTAALSIPAEIRERFTNEMFGDEDDSGDRKSVDEVFAPQEMNVLVPLYLEDARSSDEQARQAALVHLCLFSDHRVVDFLVEQGKLPATPRPSADSKLGRRCLDKFTRFGLLSEQQKSEQAAAVLEQKNAEIASMLQQERDALERIRAATFENTHGDDQVVVQMARSLKQAGDRRGMDLINEYFRAVDGTRDPATSDEEFARILQDAKLYDWVGVNLSSESDIAPAMLEGLRKVRMNYVWRTGCRFFDMRWSGRSRMFDASYAEAMLVAIDRRGPNGAPPPGAVDFCAEAFKSQLANPEVHQAFFRNAYPRLSAGQKELADRLSKEPPAPLGDYD